MAFMNHCPKNPNCTDTVKCIQVNCAAFDQFCHQAVTHN